jgi:hypothetical protein
MDTVDTNIKDGLAISKRMPISNPLIYDNLDALENMRINQMPVGLIIDGRSGSGKTTLAVHIADYLNGSPIDITKQIGFGVDDFLSKVKKCADEKLKVCIFDEAGQYSRRGAMSKLNNAMNRFFDTFRAFNMIVILCLPTMMTIDKELFIKGIVRGGIHVRRTLDSKLSALGRLYNMKEIKMVRHHFRSNPRIEESPELAYNACVPTLPSFRFRMLEPERQKKLDDIGIKAKLNILSDQAAKMEGLVCAADIMEELEISKNVVFKELSKAKAKAVKRIGAKKYYSKDVLFRIKENRSLDQKRGEANLPDNEE